MQSDRRPIRSLGEDPLTPLDRARWPATLAPVRQILDEGLELGPATVFVGANGVGKSTIVEAIALAYGLSAEGGSTGAQHSTRATESPLADHLRLVRHPGATKRGYFLRAETMHGLFTYLEKNPPQASAPADIRFHELSHGESFLTLALDRFKGPGLWVLDEPESALSFDGSLALLGHLKNLVAEGSQVVLSTHSPLLAALPGATIYEVGPWGLTPRAWERLEFVQGWKSFFAGPARYLDRL